jgi:hypothetical protein
MRKTLVLVLSIVVMASLYGTASAWTLRVRHDPNDTPRRPDIRKISTDLTATQLFIKISTWQRFGPRDAYFISRLDTSGTKDYDRILELYGGGDGPTCLLEKYPSFVVVGDRPARRSDARSVSCVFPRDWFPRIQRAVRFYVSTPHDGAGGRDRAPNLGVYRWI